MKTYELFEGEELKIAEIILQRRLQLLVHSCIYYEMNRNIISDRQWDIWAKELKALQAEYPVVSEKVDWYDAFADWDASTGAFLPLKDAWVIKKAKQLLALTNSVCAGGRSIGKTAVVNEAKTLLDIKPVRKDDIKPKRLF